MRIAVIVATALTACVGSLAARGDERSPSALCKLNNLVSVLRERMGVSKSGTIVKFSRERAGWTSVSAVPKGKGTIRVVLDPESIEGGTTLIEAATRDEPIEAVRHVAPGDHGALRIELQGEVRAEQLVVKAIPDLLHCGLGFNSSIKSYPQYDMAFLKRDVLPNVTALVVPSNTSLSKEEIDRWHRAGRRFIAEVGVNSQARTCDEHFRFWTSTFERAPWLDGIIINEFGMNRAEGPLRPERMARAKKRHDGYEQAFVKMRADDRYKNKIVYAYFGGSGNVVNYEDTGKTFVRSIIDCNYRIALERYIFERSSEQGSKDALDRLVEGIADWEKSEPGAKRHMTIAFGLFSMPPGGINKLPKVDYHVWMDQQMNVVANHPVMQEIDGLEWWTSLLADEETVRFVGKLYRHYGIEGKTEMLTRDPLFMTHLVNADFEKGTEGWTLQPAESGTIEPKSFPRYGRIEGRYMGLGRPADPEHLGDTFLWMKRSEKGPNSFSQTIKDLEPGRLYSLKMFSCDYQDLTRPQAKQEEAANKFLGRVELDGVEIDGTRSFREMYASNPEPKIPVWITYHWFVFRAKDKTAKVTVSDWENVKPAGPFGQEQTFNFLELQPYHD